ncbi:hypothetical protein [Haloterrigena salifodinae]|uniref:hypothetical protein n=1 Tax=Haloterrigena salifodinae TaxID=2675099 RepID=UPI000F89515E|nr:hypothetical protein [Haloterrigena salifodinae]
MADPTTQLTYALENLFPDRPVSIDEVREFFSNAETLDYVMYSSATKDELEQIIVIAGVQSISIENYQDFSGPWLGPHNAGVHWKEHSHCETATEVADFYAKGGWSFIELEEAMVDE